MKKEYLIYKLSDTVKCSCRIDNELFTKFGVKRGLRNEDGSGVLVGLTNNWMILLPRYSKRSVSVSRKLHFYCCLVIYPIGKS